MESLILGGLAYLGNNINNKKNIKKKKHTQKDKMKYNTNIMENINNISTKQAKIIKDGGYATQFDELKFDNNDKVVGPNESNMTFNGFDLSLQRDIDFNNQYSEFGKTQMHYDVTTKENFLTSNMAHETSKRDYTVSKDHNHIIGLYTGDESLYMSKDNFDPKPLFEPMKDLTNPFGTPNNTDFYETRYIPSIKNNNGDLPFKNNMKVAPGIKDKNQEGKGAVYRIIPKTTNELRSKNNPKLTYNAIKNEAIKKGEYRATKPNFTKDKNVAIKERKSSDNLPNYGITKKPKHGKFKNINTNRTISKQVMGGAYDPTKGNLKKGNYKKSNKITYTSDNISRSVSNITSKPVLQNKESFRNIETERSTTNSNAPGQVTDVAKGSYAIDINDIPLTTLRQLMIDGDNNIGVTNNYNKNVYAFSKDNVLPQTIRETTELNNLEGILDPTKRGHIYNPNDKPNTTIKETTVYNTVDGILNPRQKKNKSYNPNDIPYRTIKETTVHNTVDGILNPRQKKSKSFNPNDIPDRTIKETTVHNIVDGILNPKKKNVQSYNPLDCIDTTIRETTELNTFEGVLNPKKKNVQSYDPMNILDPTIRETTELNTIEGILNPKKKNVHSYDPMNIPNPTIKETTLHTTDGNGISVNNMGYTIDTKNKAKQTIKETTLHATNGNGISVNNIGYTIDTKNKAKKTIKETTLGSTQGGRIKDVNMGYSRDIKDKARVTIKQTTLHSTPNGRVGIDGNIGYSKDRKDLPRATIKQTTLYSTPGGRVGKDNNIGYSKDINEKAKPTIRQTTQHSTAGGRVGINNNIGYSKDINDKAKNTIKQTTLYSIPGVVGKDGNTTYSLDKNDKARNTIKQTTIVQQYTQPLGGEEKSRSQQAEQNMTIDDKKQILTYNRPRGPKSDLAGPKINKNEVRLKTENFIERENVGFISGDYVGKNCEQLDKTYTRNKVTLNTSNYTINNNFINTLKNNDLVNDIMHPRN